MNNKNYRKKNDKSEDIRYWTIRKLMDKYITFDYMIHHDAVMNYNDTMLFYAVDKELEKRGRKMESQWKRKKGARR